MTDSTALHIPQGVRADADEPEGNLYDALGVMQSPQEWQQFLTDLCTPAELRALSSRWKVAQYLDIGNLSYRDISERTGASTTTVGRVARFLFEEPHQGYRLALDRVAKKESES